jgi:hypothetical protein
MDRLVTHNRKQKIFLSTLKPIEIKKIISKMKIREII